MKTGNGWGGGRGAAESRPDRAMGLDRLLAGAPTGKITGPAGVRIQAVAYDSRNVTPGAMFFALRGEKLDGAKFVDDAIARGAVAIATENAAQVSARGVAVVELLPGSDRRALATASANFYGRPADTLKLVGITGTNGKTTTAFLIDSILRAAGRTTGLIGTIGSR